jgi:hypothetical protein
MVGLVGLVPVASLHLAQLAAKLHAPRLSAVKSSTVWPRSP